MKKLATLLIAAGLVFGATAPAANAIDFKAKGEWVMSFDYGQNGNFTGGHGQTGYGKNGEDEFEAKQRLRLQLDAVASENLSGTVFFEIGNTTWGQDEGGALGGDGKIVEVRRAYIDWMVPNTELKVRMGLQGMEEGVEGPRLQVKDVVGPLPQGGDHLVAVHLAPGEEGEEQHPGAAGDIFFPCHGKTS